MFRSSTDTMRAPIESSHKVNSPKTYSCDLCEHSEWQNETEMEIHRKTTHKNALFKLLVNKNNHFCRICVRQFSDRTAVVRHIKSTHLLSSPSATRVERQIFICEYCNNIFFNKKLLSAHIVHLHSPKIRRDIERLECPMCKKMLKLQTVWSHLVYHESPCVSTCPICLKYCENKTFLAEHLKSHPFYFNCDICGFQTRNSSTFYQHTGSHKSDVQRRVNITYDEVVKSFASRFHMPWKYEIDPTGLKGLRLPQDIRICVLCREICSDIKMMREHLRTDHVFEEVTKKVYKCVCGEEFFNNVLLKHHIFKLKGEHRVDENNQEVIVCQVEDESSNCEDDIAEPQDIEEPHIFSPDIMQYEENKQTNIMEYEDTMNLNSDDDFSCDGDTEAIYDDDVDNDDDVENDVENDVDDDDDVENDVENDVDDDDVENDVENDDDDIDNDVDDDDIDNDVDDDDVDNDDVEDDVDNDAVDVEDDDDNDDNIKGGKIKLVDLLSQPVGDNGEYVEVVIP